MNFMTLSAGDAIYIPADAPHAYLSGDIIECMARSNTAINTGFCPRAHRDNIDLFTSALAFGPQSAEEPELPSKQECEGPMWQHCGVCAADERVQHAEDKPKEWRERGDNADFWS